MVRPAKLCPAGAVLTVAVGGELAGGGCRGPPRGARRAVDVAGSDLVGALGARDGLAAQVVVALGRDAVGGGRRVGSRRRQARRAVGAGALVVAGVVGACQARGRSRADGNEAITGRGDWGSEGAGASRAMWRSAWLSPAGGDACTLA